ncbi:MAG: DUF2723 domain-containing protein [candidate division WOR-3 bacterium]|nr:DUF2723 domain-containing protein [candidate division WOR-3 bacterium]
MLYFHTKLPAVGLIDSGELAAGCYLLNILHPTGYPLYTILGRLFSLLPFSSVVHRLTYLSICCSSAGIIFFLLICLREKITPVVAIVVASLLAISPPLWNVSTDVEIYSLTFLLSFLLWFLAENVENTPYLLALSYFAGLTLTNHLTGLWTVAGIITTIFLSRHRKIIRLLTPLLLLFILGLSPYLFLILRARTQPLLAWGNPVNFEQFWWHISGRQYRVWMFASSLGAVTHNAGRGLTLIAQTFGYILIPIVFYGIIILFKKKRPLATGLTITVTLCFLYAVNYGIPDIAAYYLPAIAALSIFASAGLDALFHHFGKICHIVCVIPIAMLLTNYPVQNQNQNWVAYDQAVNTLESADTGAIIITDWWDVYAPSFYLQEIEKIRTDICIIDKELVRRSWYFNYLEKKYPWLISNSQHEVDEFLFHLRRFEHGQPYDPSAIQASYIKLLRSFLVNNPGRSTYITFPATSSPDAQQLVKGFYVLPQGILFRLQDDSLLPEFDYHRLRVRIPRYGLNERTRLNLARYQIFVQERLRLLENNSRYDEAHALKEWYRQQFVNFL